jgi:predicted alpha/beta hydrolase family esterase
MPRRPSRTVPTVLLTGPGTTESDWPLWLAGQLTEAGRQLHRCDVTPDLPASLQALASSLADLPEDGYDVVAHAAGCLLWLQHTVASVDSPRPARVALIAPPSATEPAELWRAYYPVPLEIDSVRKAADGTVLVGSDNDPACPSGVATEYGAPLKMATTVLPGAGGLTAADGYGPWPAVLDWCGRDNLAFRA